jgi:hypothetical protein
VATVELDNRSGGWTEGVMAEQRTAVANKVEKKERSKMVNKVQKAVALTEKEWFAD